MLTRFLTILFMHLLLIPTALAVPVTFSVCDSKLNGKSFDCSATPHHQDALSFDSGSNKWKSRNIYGLRYLGTYDASSGNDPAGSPVSGDYYIVSSPGVINLVPYSIGDWISFNGSEWQKVANTRSVFTVFGRTGAIVAKEGDYKLDQMGDVDLTTTLPAVGNTLSFISGKWIPVSPVAGAPVGTAGGDLTGSYPNPLLTNTGVTPGTYRSVTVDGKGRVTSGTNPTTIAGYGITDPYLSSITGVTPLVNGGTTNNPTLSIPLANSTTNGYVSATDWTNFNNKQFDMSAGGTINGITYPASTSQTLKIALDPVNLTDAVNKNYVDSTSSTWTLASGNVYRTDGKVGIGTSSPDLTLTVGNGSSHDGLIVASGFGTVGSSGITITNPSSSGTMYWYSKKGAFGAGGVSKVDANIGNYSTALGSVVVKGQYSFGHASGTINSNNSLAVGLLTTAMSFTDSVCIGSTSTCNISSASFAGASASGQKSLSMGPLALATAINTTTIGYNNQSAGDISQSFNVNNFSAGYAQTTFGQRNHPIIPQTPSSWVPTDFLFLVANGDSSYTPYSQAFVLLKNGKLGIGNVTAPATTLQVAGIIAPDSDGSRDLGTATFRFKNIYATNSLIQTSDLRTKKKIEDSGLGIQFIHRLRPVSYRFRIEDKIHYGFIAQELQKESKNSIVSYDKSSDRYGIRYTELLSPLTKSFQEIYKKISAFSLTDVKTKLAESEETNSKLLKEICTKDPGASLCK